MGFFSFTYIRQNSLFFLSQFYERPVSIDEIYGIFSDKSLNLLHILHLMIFISLSDARVSRKLLVDIFA